MQVFFSALESPASIDTTAFALFPGEVSGFCGVRVPAFRPGSFAGGAGEGVDRRRLGCSVRTLRLRLVVWAVGPFGPPGRAWAMSCELRVVRVAGGGADADLGTWVFQAKVIDRGLRPDQRRRGAPFSTPPRSSLFRSQATPGGRCDQSSHSPNGAEVCEHPNLGRASPSPALPGKEPGRNGGTRTTKDPARSNYRLVWGGRLRKGAYGDGCHWGGAGRCGGGLAIG